MGPTTGASRAAASLPRGRPLLVLTSFVLVPVLLLIGWASLGYLAARFAHHSAVADARIIDSDSGCLSAYGSRSPTSGGSIVYEIEFPYAGGLHTTSVRRPCRVIPPDFGRGRGYLWIEYDRDNPDRVRVLNDDTLAIRTRQLRDAFVTVLVAEGVILLWWLRRRTPRRASPRRS